MPLSIHVPRDLRSGTMVLMGIKLPYEDFDMHVMYY